MADFSATFLTSYDTRSGPQNKSFELPAGAEVSNSSSCGKENASDSSLVITFGRGHTLTLTFTRNATRYKVQLMRFAYNLSDTDTFPNSSFTGVKTVESATDIKADVNTTYRCVSETQVHMGSVTVTLRDAAIQAYLSSSNFSRAETRCEQDLPTPTTPPQPSPTPAPSSPVVFRYNVSGSNGTCLLASMGLQLNVTYRTVDNKTVTREFNVNPNKTTFGGNCSTTLATLSLSSENLLLLVLQFVMNESSSKVFLQGVQLNLTLPDAEDVSFTATNSSLRALQATAGNSYKCNTEQRLQVTSTFSLNLFRVWVQAFRVDGDKFGPEVGDTGGLQDGGLVMLEEGQRHPEDDLGPLAEQAVPDTQHRLWRERRVSAQPCRRPRAQLGALTSTGRTSTKRQMNQRDATRVHSTPWPSISAATAGSFVRTSSPSTSWSVFRPSIEGL
uniref:Lysosome-associated membrane glycoprotein 1 n=1 Tax=Capra hircus TaxID=9925 RepID=A0A8C2RZZ4_CAPHI